MEWTAPAIILDIRPHGEGGAIATLLTEQHGRHAGLAKGGSSRGQSALWQPGNLVEARWVARLPEQLGALSAEMVHPAAALAMEDPLALAALRSACAVAEGALPEREAHPRSFHGLVAFIATLARGTDLALPDLVRWEADLLADLGYGLDFSACAVTGGREDLAFVSPKSARAVSAAAAGEWRDRLLPLPAFLLGQGPSGPVDWAAGLRLTGHFLARDVFGVHNRGLPAARDLLVDRVTTLASPAASG
ncbi:DNA repair protein RecO [Falsiroseomonas sp. E2-1-a20]|uniref:DNA repair protein RecO n=1 Tax=Falsiroseomonas sp. E2-1-a20 TaxID=3239300 RepID=UPI003F409280